MNLNMRNFHFPWNGNNLTIIIFIGQTGSIYFTVLISFERFIAVYWPLKSRAMFTMSKAKIFVWLILILAAILNIFDLMPILFRLAQYRPPRWLEILLQHILVWGPTIFNYVIPFVPIISLNLLIGIRVS